MGETAPRAAAPAGAAGSSPTVSPSVAGDGRGRARRARRPSSGDAPALGSRDAGVGARPQRRRPGRRPPSCRDRRCRAEQCATRVDARPRDPRLRRPLGIAGRRPARRARRRRARGDPRVRGRAPGRATILGRSSSSPEPADVAGGVNGLTGGDARPATRDDIAARSPSSPRACAPSWRATAAATLWADPRRRRASPSRTASRRSSTRTTRPWSSGRIDDVVVGYGILAVEELRDGVAARRHRRALRRARGAVSVGVGEAIAGALVERVSTSRVSSASTSSRCPGTARRRTSSRSRASRRARS